MDTDTSGQAPRPEVNAHVASCVIRVSNLDPSLTFYRDVFSFRSTCTRASPFAAGAATLRCRYLMWATESESDLQQVAQRLRTYDTAAYTYTENGVTFLEGCDPDGGRVIVAHPSPRQLPRTVIAERLRG